MRPTAQCLMRVPVVVHPLTYTSRNTVSPSPCSRTSIRHVARTRRPRDQRRTPRRLLDRHQQRIGLVQLLAVEIRPRHQPAHQPARQDAQRDMRRLLRIAAARHRPRLHRDEAVLPLRVGVAAPEPRETVATPADPTARSPRRHPRMACRRHPAPRRSARSSPPVRRSASGRPRTDPPAGASTGPTVWLAVALGMAQCPIGVAPRPRSTTSKR